MQATNSQGNCKEAASNLLEFLKKSVIKISVMPHFRLIRLVQELQLKYFPLKNSLLLCQKFLKITPSMELIIIFQISLYSLSLCNLFHFLLIEGNWRHIHGLLYKCLCLQQLSTTTGVHICSLRRGSTTRCQHDFSF